MFYTLQYLFIINEAPHRAFNSSSTSVRNLTDDQIARELRRNSISIDKTTVHDTPSVQPIRDITIVQDHLSQSEMSSMGSPPFKLQGLTILTILNLKSKSFNCWQVTDHLRKLFPTYCQSDHFTVVMLKVVMFMSQNPQIFIRNEIINFTQTQTPTQNLKMNFYHQFPGNSSEFGIIWNNFSSSKI